MTEACAQTYFESSNITSREPPGNPEGTPRQPRGNPQATPREPQATPREPLGNPRDPPGSRSQPRLESSSYRRGNLEYIEQFMLKHRSFARSTMPRRFPRTCPVCGRPHLKNLSTHLFKVHGLSPEERKPHLKQAQVSSWQVTCPPPSANAEKPREKRVSQWEHSPPAKRPRTATHTTSLATKSCPEFNFRHKFSLLVVGPTQSGKTYFVQQILENSRIVYEEQKSIRIFWYYNQWQECYEKLKKSLGKSIRFERGVPELSEDLCEINARYNNIIILDDLMAEATDTVLWYLDCLPKAAIETPALSYCCKTCFLRGNIIRISAEMPSTWLSSEVLAIENKLELSGNTCLTRIECTLCTLITKRPKNRMGICWWITNPAHHPIIKFLQTYLGNAMLITSV